MTAISPSHHSSIIHQHHKAHGTAQRRRDMARLARDTAATRRDMLATWPRHGRDMSRHACDTAATRPRHGHDMV
eukprot:99195-Prymnesium_polylepis.1